MRIGKYEVKLTARGGLQFRNLTKYNNNNPIYGFRSVGGQSVGRTPVTEETALSLASFWAGVRAISEKVAEFPTDVMRIENGAKRVVPHPTLRLLKGRANRFANSFDYTQILVASAIMHGNGFAVIAREGSTVTELMNIHAQCVRPFKWDGELWYELDIDDNENIIVAQEDMIHLKGFGTDPCVGISIIEQHRITLGLTLAARDYGVDVFNKGTRVDGIVKTPGKLDKEMKDRIAESWIKNYGPNGDRGIAILDGGNEWQDINMMSPEDLQFLETRNYQAREIATILGVPPHMVGDNSKVSYNNMEQYNQQFLQSLLGWIAKIEQEYNTKLLAESEKGSTTYRLNFNSMLRADTESRSKFYEILFRNGMVTPNEVRAWEDLNPYDGGDTFFMMLNMDTVDNIINGNGQEDNTDGGASGDGEPT